MANRRWLIAPLIGVNLALLLALVGSLDWLPRAWAQPSGGRAGDFVSVTAKAAGQSYDVLYLLDVPNRKLHAFYPGNVQTRELAYGGFRDLKTDFGK